MNDNNVLAFLANICIYYYISYYEKILFKKVNIPNKALPGLMKRIRGEYIKDTHSLEIYDISIMTFPYNKQYILNKDNLDIIDVIECIDYFIDNNHHIYYNETPLINVVSISNHPIENSFCISHSWIKQAIDLYIY